ncbi:serine/threonine protein phosphatase [Sulfitobacter sp. SK012]|uniref:metallophosphoesterase family protein n=1 Tax=Sulfitobacter sp. SK012 TaxID=1389005 RepID=UPI000E09F407|nr:metallophosphoesterase family protein [Sulfitobacter sp. SK012]AXI48655.1 serine/threonine protein phosphatase [Sulfitobacter sp. SK012]
MTNAIYAIGDIHGQLSQLERVLGLIEKDGGRDAQIVFLGDYTDRGPKSRDVLDVLIEGRDAQRNWTFLKGNHDRMFEWFLESPLRHDPFLMVELYWLHPRLGGDTTLVSYGVDASGRRREKDVHRDSLEAIPKKHIAFLNELKLSHAVEDLMFVHAGIRPDVALDAQIEEDLLWIRQEFHDHLGSHPKLIIHGHTPVDAATHYGNRVNLDTGAGYGKPLTAAVFEGGQCWQLTDRGRVLLDQEAQ